MSASFELPDITSQYPDLLATEAKVGAYCLDSRHPENKYRGFQRHGYDTSEASTIRLASLFCGAFLNSFEPQAVVAASKGELQFGLRVLIPSKFRVFAPVNAAWIAEPNLGLRLTTAYTALSGADYVFPVNEILPQLSIEDAWYEVWERAQSFSELLKEGDIAAIPRVYIPRNGVSKELASILAKSEFETTNFRRAALGGSALLVTLGDFMSWSQASALTYFAQIQLGLKGVRSVQGVFVD